jgi:CheY-like chemotaxis protein
VKVLILEDHDGVRESIELLLEVEGCTVVSFASATAALKYLESEFVDLAIIDWNLPEMSGGEFLVKARGVLLPLFTPQLVLFSGDFRVADRAQELGADAFLAKPFKPNALSELVRSLAKQHPVVGAPVRDGFSVVA